MPMRLFRQIIKEFFGLIMTMTLIAEFLVISAIGQDKLAEPLSANYAVEGTVVDMSGKPVAQARVFNSGDGPEPMETRSDDAGKFKLKGFRKGPVYVFAEKEGYRFAGLRTESDVADAVLKMLRSDEPAPQRPADWRTSLIEEEKKAAHKVLEKNWATATGSQRQQARYKMARIDPELAAKWAVEANVKPADIPEPKPLSKIADEDIDDALAVVAKQPFRQAYSSLNLLIVHFSASDPEKAMRCAEEIVVLARGADQPFRTEGLAMMGLMVSRLGNKVAGKKLADEAAEMAAKLQPAGGNTDAFGALVLALAQTDISRAKSMAEKIPDKTWRDSYLSRAAYQQEDVEQAKLLLADVQFGYAQQSRMQLAYSIAAKRPAEAIQLVEKMQTGQSGIDEYTRASAFGWLAAAIVSSDAKMAHSLIDRAFAIYSRPALGLNTGKGSRSAQAAATAIIADRIGYPDMQSLVYRVLATRPTTKDGDSPAAAQESCVMMAMYLALIDPQTAKQVLQDIEPASDLIGSGQSGVGRKEWLKAWALVDPQHALELADQDAARAQNDTEKRIVSNAVTEMLERIWLARPIDRIRILGGDAILFTLPLEDERRPNPILHGPF
jgi:Carboxypeptidase regulatory-like domain